ncbi:hypothetical protein DB31_3577 [Hyalangium minutum]|uniref:Uncharacterized protein n=1 Tax=Hyalangium minutum TaxID=394096 RepID=A0A085WUT4_9BACT|nr:hypothetical protein DB31_3577 [Hyalangium minutum]
MGAAVGDHELRGPGLPGEAAHHREQPLHLHRLPRERACAGRLYQKKLFGTPWLTFREESRRPTRVIAALLA